MRKKLLVKIVMKLQLYNITIVVLNVLKNHISYNIADLSSQAIFSSRQYREIFLSRSILKFRPEEQGRVINIISIFRR